MKVVKGEQIKKIDKSCYEDFGIKTLIFMEHAGIAVTEEIIKDHLPSNKVLIVAGKGNNGGDGFVVARLLNNRGYTVKVLLLSKTYHGDAEINLNILRKTKIELIEDVKNLTELLSWCDLAVDCIFGIGFQGEALGNYQETINLINQSGKNIISVDIPSGLTADGNIINRWIIKANKTITLGLIKENLLLYPGRDLAGQLVLKDIGIPKELIDSIPSNTHLLTENNMKTLLPIRQNNSHKGTFGTGMIVGGNIGMSGAVILGAQSALRAGIGLLYTVVKKELLDVVESNCHETITVVIPDKLEDITTKLEGTDALLIGPGLSTFNTEELFFYFVKNYRGKMVIDGDGLNLLAKSKDYDLLNENIVLTPHPKEMSRLTDLSVEQIIQDPINIAREFSTKHKCTLVLKGSTTCIATKDGNVYLNITGNNGLSTGGSGDVLAGLIMSFMAQGMDGEAAAKLGVYLHGLTADIVAKEKGYHSLLPSDLPQNLHKGFKFLKS